jgi:hypothetical protein
MPERSFLQKAFMDPPKRPNGDQPWDSLTPEEKDALLAQAQKDRLYGRSQPSYMAQGMQAAMEALGPKPKDTPQAKVPEAQTWNQFMDTQDTARKAQAQTRTFTPVATFPVGKQPKSAGEAQADQMLAVKKAGTIEERWKALQQARKSTPE